MAGRERSDADRQCSQRRLLPLVGTKQFVDTLYYRLNPFYIDLGSAE